MSESSSSKGPHSSPRDGCDAVATEGVENVCNSDQSYYYESGEDKKAYGEPQDYSGSYYSQADEEKVIFVRDISLTLSQQETGNEQESCYYSDDKKESKLASDKAIQNKSERTPNSVSNDGDEKEEQSHSPNAEDSPNGENDELRCDSNKEENSSYEEQKCSSHDDEQLNLHEIGEGKQTHSSQGEKEDHSSSKEEKHSEIKEEELHSSSKEERHSESKIGEHSEIKEEELHSESKDEKHSSSKEDKHSKSKEEENISYQSQESDQQHTSSSLHENEVVKEDDNKIASDKEQPKSMSKENINSSSTITNEEEKKQQQVDNEYSSYSSSAKEKSNQRQKTDSGSYSLSNEGDQNNDISSDDNEKETKPTKEEIPKVELKNEKPARHGTKVKILLTTEKVMKYQNTMESMMNAKPPEGLFEGTVFVNKINSKKESSPLQQTPSQSSSKSALNIGSQKMRVFNEDKFISDEGNRNEIKHKPEPLTQRNKYLEPRIQKHERYTGDIFTTLPDSTLDPQNDIQPKKAQNLFEDDPGVEKKVAPIKKHQFLETIDTTMTTLDSNIFQHSPEKAKLCRINNENDVNPQQKPTLSRFLDSELIETTNQGLDNKQKRKKSNRYANKYLGLPYKRHNDKSSNNGSTIARHDSESKDIEVMDKLPHPPKYFKRDIRIFPEEATDMDSSFQLVTKPGDKAQNYLNQTSSATESIESVQSLRRHSKKHHRSSKNSDPLSSRIPTISEPPFKYQEEPPKVSKSKVDQAPPLSRGEKSHSRRHSEKA